MLAGMTAFGQGYLAFTGGKSMAWLNGTIAGGAASTINVSFLWGTANALSGAAVLAGTGNVGSINTTPATNKVAWGGTDPNAAMWTAILTDANFTLALNNNTHAVVTAPVTATGGWNYGNLPVEGASACQTVYAYEIAWAAASGSTPALARTANGALGWGNVFAYTLTASTSAAGTISGAAQMGVGKYYPVPEPATIALAGLGAMGLLLFRRRK